MVRAGRGIALVFGVLAVGSSAGVASGATLHDAQRVTVATRTVSGSLRVAVTVDRGRATVTARGTLTTRSAHGSVLLSRCGDASCTKAKLTAVSSRALRHGRAALAATWRTSAATRWRAALRVGHGTIVSVVLRPTAPATVAVPAPLAPAAAAPAPAPAATPASITARAIAVEPGLVPAYDPAVPDYTVACPGGSVRLRAALPAGDTIAVDGAPAAGGTVVHDLALSPGQAFAFTLNGSERHVVRCLPSDFPLWTTERDGRADVDWIALAPTVSLAAGSKPYAVIADRYGVPVWWMQADQAIVDVKALPDGTVVWGDPTGGATGFSRSHYTHVALDGTAFPDITTIGLGVGSDDHELVELPNGNLLVEAYVSRTGVDLTAIGGPASATVLDAVIQEITPAGTVAWTWDSKDHIAVDETPGTAASVATTLPGEGTVYDLVHLNAIEPLADGDLVLSARHLDAVFRIRRSDGAVVWKLGGTPRPESLTFVDDPVGALGGQHDARILGDGTLTVHDNGRLLRPPRAVRYRLDTTARTATLIEQVDDPRVPGSFCCGSSRRLPGGHWLAAWGAAPLVTELAADGTPVLSLKMPGATFTYRAVPVSSTAVDRSALRAGMDAQHPRAPAG